MGEPAKPAEKKKSLTGKVVFFLITLVLVIGTALWFAPVFACPFCGDAESSHFIARTDKHCNFCQDTKKVSLPKLFERMSPDKH